MEFAKASVTNIRSSTIRDLCERVRRKKVGAPYLYRMVLTKIRHYENADIQFDFPVTALIGTNGGGKSTVLGAAGLIYSSVTPRTFFAKSGKYDIDMKNWSVSYEHLELGGKSVARTASYTEARWNRAAIDRPVVLLGISRTLPATERKRLTAAISNSFEGAAEMPLSDEAQQKVMGILGRDVSSYITVDIDGSGQEDRQFFAFRKQNEKGYSEFHFGAGEASIMRIVQHVEKAERGTLVLIEEIENGLHPVATRLLVDYLVNAAKRRRIQVIFTTHSDSAIAGLPESAIWACVDGTLSQGRLQISALRALTGEVEIGAALFVEDAFAEVMLEAAIRDYCRRHKDCSPQGVGIYPAGGADKVVSLVKQHNADPSIQRGSGSGRSFPAVAVLDGDCRDREQFSYQKNDNVYFLPGEVPESYIFDEVMDRIDQVANLLKKMLDLDALSEEDFVERMRKVDCICDDPHLLFSMIGDEFDYMSERRVKDAFLSVWCKECSDVVDKLVTPLVPFFPNCSPSNTSAD